MSNTIWPTLHVDITRGIGVEDSGKTFTCPPSLDGLLTHLPRRIWRVYLCGTLPADFGDWHHLFLPEGWRIDQQRGVYIDPRTEHKGTILRFQHPADRHFVEMRPITRWFDDLPASPEDARAALLLLQDRLAQSFHDVVLKGTPGSTGAYLWSHNQPKGAEYPILPDDLQDLIHSTSGQHRFEVVTTDHPGRRMHSADILPGLTCLDGKWMYAGLVRDLGIGPATHDDLPDYEAFRRPGRYHVTGRVPPDWSHLGLAMVKETSNPLVKKWCYPAEPGALIETWMDSAELLIAFWPFPHSCSDCAARRDAVRGSQVPDPCPQHGWPLHIRERILFTKPSGRGPLDTWAERLIALRAAVDSDGQEGRIDPRVAHLASAAVRNLLMHAIGSFYRRQRDATYSASEEESWRVPVGNPTVQVYYHPTTGERRFTYNEPEPNRLSLSEPSIRDELHAEFPVQVYARERARMVLHKQYPTGIYTGALALPLSSIAAMWGDSLYTDHDPDWPISHRPGQLRPKGRINHPIPRPRTYEEFIQWHDEIDRSREHERPSCCSHRKSSEEE